MAAEKGAGSEEQAWKEYLESIEGEQKSKKKAPFAGLLQGVIKKLRLGKRATKEEEAVEKEIAISAAEGKRLAEGILPKGFLQQQKAALPLSLYSCLVFAGRELFL